MAAVARLLATLVAYAATAVALAPLLRSGAPLGGRPRSLRAREGQVIRLRPRREALPR